MKIFKIEIENLVVPRFQKIEIKINKGTKEIVLSELLIEVETKNQRI